MGQWHGSWVNGSLVTSPMGHMGHGSQKVTHCQLGISKLPDIVNAIYLLLTSKIKLKIENVPLVVHLPTINFSGT